MRTRQYISFGVFAIILVVGIMLRLFGESGTQFKTVDSTDSDNQALIRKLRSLNGVQVVASRLRYPDSIKLESVIYMSDDSVCYQFCAKNGSGGVNRNYSVETPEGSIPVNDDDNGPDDSVVTAWNKYCSHKQGESVMAKD